MKKAKRKLCALALAVLIPAAAFARPAHKGGRNMKTKIKKHFGKAAMLLAVVLFAFVLLPVTAFAATGAQDGLVVEITTDKSNYAAGDTVTVNLSVTNNNAAAVNNVKLEVSLPSGLRLQTGSGTLTIASLAAGVTETHSFTALATASSTTTSQTSDSASQTGSPQTGDGSNLALWVFLLAASVGGLAGLVYFKKHKAAKLLSMFLCLTMITALIAPAQPVYAATVTKNFSVSENITVGGSAKKITLTTSYDWEEVDVTGVTLDTNTVSLSVGGVQSLPETQQLTATVSPDTALNKNVTWESSAPGVATVDNGLVTAVSVGTATITVKTVDGNYTDICVVTVGSLAASNAEATKITGFMAGTNTTSTLVFNASGYNNLTSGTTITLVDVKTGEAGPGTPTNLGASFSSGALSLNTQQTVLGTGDNYGNYNGSFSHSLNYVSVTFTATYNGVTSDPVTLDISGLFATGTTAAKLRNDIAALGTSNEVNTPSDTTGDVSLFPSITLSSGVSIPQTVYHSSDNNGEGYLHADAGGVVYVNFTVAPTIMAGIKFVLKLSCAETSVQVHDNFDVIVVML